MTKKQELNILCMKLRLVKNLKTITGNKKKKKKKIKKKKKKKQGPP